VSQARVKPQQPTSARGVNSSLTPVLLVTTFLTLFLIGMVVSSWGAAVSFIKLKYAVSDASVGLLGSAQAFGGVLGNIATGVLQKGFRAGLRMALGVACFGFGCLLFFLVHSWLFAIVAALILGFGIGVFQVNFASLFSSGFGVRSGAVMNVMTTAFSFGSISGPLIVVGLLERFDLMFLAVALFMLLSFGLVFPARDSAPTQTSNSGLIFQPKLLGFALVCLFYVSAEVGVNFWMPTYLQSVGYGLPEAAKFASWFWIALTLGRFLAIPISLRVSSINIVLGCLSLSIASLMLSQIPGFAAVGYVATGLFFAPVFPTGLVWINREFASLGATSVWMVAGSTGAFLVAPAIGALKQSSGASAIPISLMVLTIISLLAAVWLRTLPEDVR
jgi:MFS transporter, FHS family, glucose/mannose:H+ symporter